MQRIEFDFVEVFPRRIKPMKKTIIAALASLMLAGAISAASGATTNTSTGAAVIVGEGGSPIPVAPFLNSSTDGQSNHQR
jgi:hypothetical protein